MLIKDAIRVDIYSKYKIRIDGVYKNLSEENETIYDNIFVEDEIHKIIEIRGYELLNKIAENIKDDYISDFIVENNEIHFEYFNYNNGESSSLCYTILDYVEEH